MFERGDRARSVGGVGCQGNVPDFVERLDLVVFVLDSHEEVDARLGIDPDRGGVADAGAEGRQNRLGDFFLIDSQIFGPRAVDLHVELRVIERLRNLHVGSAGDFADHFDHFFRGVARPRNPANRPN